MRRPKYNLSTQVSELTPRQIGALRGWYKRRNGRVGIDSAEYQRERHRRDSLIQEIREQASKADGDERKKLNQRVDRMVDRTKDWSARYYIMTRIYDQLKAQGHLDERKKQRRAS